MKPKFRIGFKPSIKEWIEVAVIVVAVVMVALLIGDKK